MEEWDFRRREENGDGLSSFMQKTWYYMVNQRRRRGTSEFTAFPSLSRVGPSFPSVIFASVVFPLNYVVVVDGVVGVVFGG